MLAQAAVGSMFHETILYCHVSAYFLCLFLHRCQNSQSIFIFNMMVCKKDAMK